MQKKQTESAKSAQRVGVEEKLINFRSSPNFRNMKKFFRQRMMPPEGVQNTEVPQVNPIVEPKPPAIHPPAIHPPAIPPPAIHPPAIHPPLPRDPPPPDNPEPLLIPKLEREDPPTIYDEDTYTHHFIPQEYIKTDEYEDRKPKTVCKDFIRGSCMRANCRFVHENSAPHRFGVYRFCKKYQNGVCDLEFCRYVHADTFQEAHYYRTGILPPNALAHIKNNVPKPPPTPTAPPQLFHGHLQGIQPSCSMVMNMTPGPPMMSPHLEQQMPLIQCLSQVGPMMPNVKMISEAAFALSNFNWMSNAISMQHNKYECSNCDYVKYRYQNTKQLAEERSKSLETIQQKIDDIDHKTRMMNLIFLLLLRSHTPQPNVNPMECMSLESYSHMMPNVHMPPPCPPYY